MGNGGNKGSKKNDPAKLSEEEINLLLANTSFKREEILQWHAGFIVSVKTLYFNYYYYYYYCF